MKKWMWILGFLLVAAIALLIPYNCWFNGQNVFSDYHLINVCAGKGLSYGELGDFVGGIIGTVVAGIACIMVYLTYKGQCELSEKQQFETTFFNLIHIHKESLEAIKTIHYIPDDYISQTKEENQPILTLPPSYAQRDITIDEIKENESLLDHLQGEEAMRVDYIKRKNLQKYYHTPWFNSICMILEYLKDNKKNEKSFYTKYFYSQITRPEWWFLYAIFQNKEKLDSDTEHFNNYVALATDMHLFEFGYYYIVEKNSNIKRDKIYEKNEF